MIRVGRYHVASIVSGYDRLDGGAMFGVVPKALWAKTEEVDEAIEEKERVFAMCRDEGLRLAFCHDRSAGAVSIAWRNGKPEVGEILDLGLPRA